MKHASFRLRSRTAALVTDPYDPSVVGIKYPKVEADIITISHQHKDHNFVQAVGGDPVIVQGPGEYEIKGVKIIGISCFHDASNGKDKGENTIYRINMDQINIVHLGDLGHKLDEKIQDVIGDVDVLMIPVGGYYTISPALVSEVISQLDPKITIPMHYNQKDIDQNNFSQLSKLEIFLKEVGKEEIKPIPKLTITKDKLPSEPMMVVLE